MQNDELAAKIAINPTNPDATTFASTPSHSDSIAEPSLADSSAREDSFRIDLAVSRISQVVASKAPQNSPRIKLGRTESSRSLEAPRLATPAALAEHVRIVFDDLQTQFALSTSLHDDSRIAAEQDDASQQSPAPRSLNFAPSQDLRNLEAPRFTILAAVHAHVDNSRIANDICASQRCYDLDRCLSRTRFRLRTQSALVPIRLYFYNVSGLFHR